MKSPRSALTVPLVALLLLGVALLGLPGSFFRLANARAAGYSYNWEDARGPGEGEAEDLCYDEARGVLYRTTFGRGAWKYQGGFWSELEAPEGLRFLYRCVLDTERNVLYAGTYDHGVWRCENPDTAPAWSAVGTALDGWAVFALYYEPVNNDLFAGTGQHGAWRCDSPDTSGTWVDMGGLTTSNINGFAYDPDQPCLFATSNTTPNQGVWLVADPHATPHWAKISTGAANALDAVSITYDNTGGILYAGMGDPATWMGKGLWRCTDPFAAVPAWTDMGTVSGQRVYGLLYSGTDDTLLVGTRESLWACQGPGTATPDWTASGLSLEAYAIVRTGSGVIYAGTSKDGVWSCPYSTDPGTWTSLGGGLSSDPVDVQVYDATHDRLYTGSWYGALSRCDNPGLAPSWTEVDFPNKDKGAYSLAVDEYRDILYLTRDDPGGEVLRGTSPGTTPDWTAIGPPATIVGAMAFDPSHNILYAVTSGGIQRCPNPDSSSTWTVLPGTQPVNSNKLAYDAAHDVLYVGTSDHGIWRCDDPGASSSWTDTGGGINYYIRNLVYSAELDRLFAATSDHGVLRCDDPRTAPVWSDTGGALSTKSVNGLAYDGLRDLLYASADSGGGGAVCTDPGGTPLWGPMGGELSNDHILSLSCDANNGTVFAGTDRRGLWYTSETRFFFAEGYTGTGFQEYLCIANPSLETADLVVSYLFSDGTSMQSDYTIEGQHRFTVDVNAEVGPDREVSVVARSQTRGLVVERPLYFDYGAGWTGGSDVMGAPDASDAWYFAEGYTGTGFDEWVCVLNPGNQDAGLAFFFQTQEEGPVSRGGYYVGAHSRATFKVNDVLGANYQCSLKLASDQPVVAERPMYFDYTGTPGDLHWDGGHCVMGASRPAQEFDFAEGTTRAGFEEWITVQNPNPYDIEVTTEYQLGGGAIPPAPKVVTVEAGTRETLFVPSEVGTEQDVSARLTSSGYFLAERPMYFDYTGYGADYTGGSCVIGAVAPADNWYFAEGYTGSGFQTWLTLQNPGSTDATVEVTYLTQEEGALPTQQIVVPAGTRGTVRVNDAAGEGLQVSTTVMVAQGSGVIVERPMYFTFYGWTGGHDVVGFNP